MSISIPLLVAAGGRGASKIKRKSILKNLSQINGTNMEEDAKMGRTALYTVDQLDKIVAELHPQIKDEDELVKKVIEALETKHDISGMNEATLSAKVKRIRDRIVSREQDDLVASLDEADAKELDRMGRIFVREASILLSKRANAVRARTADTLDELREKLVVASGAKDEALAEIASLKKDLAAATADLAERDRLLDAKTAEIAAMAGEIRAYKNMLPHLNKTAESPGVAA